MDDLIRSLAGASQGDKEESQPARGSDLLSSLLGGLAGAGQAQSTPGGSNAAGLLGSLLGGGGSGGLLANLLGGGQSASNPLVDNVAAQVSAKLGLDSALGKMIVTFAISKLVPMILGALTGQATAATPAAPEPAPSPAPKPAPSAAGLQGLLQMVMGKKTVTSSYLRSTGLSQELSEQAGIDTKTAEKGLKQTFELLGEQMAGDETLAAVMQMLGQ